MRRYLSMLMMAVLLTDGVHGQTSGQAWRDHLTRQDVVSALGDPEGDVVNGASERMIYKDNLLIVLTNNEVTSIEGPVPDALKPMAAPPPAAPTPPAANTPATATPAPVTTPPAQAAPATTSTSGPKNSVPTPVSSAPSSPSTSTGGDAGSQGEQDSEKIINDFSTTSIIPQGTPISAAISKALGPGADGSGDGGGGLSTAGLPKGLAALAGGAAPAGATSPWSTAGTWQWFVAGLLLKTVIMTLVLKGTFAYKEFPVLWREAGFVAAGVSLCNQVLALLFSMNDFGKIAAMVQADQLIAGAVLLALIMNFTAAKQFPTAAGIMIAAMSANIAVGYAQLFFF